ncbi:DUF4352 domain-containing protein [Propionibacteriaceae bacterium G1746]|uniref:DUF4352 domain-containing protein n=1 Tax=Aestuariimicrobium sp. G57 TaxID=3418485 RepID=UPI003C1DC875
MANNGAPTPPQGGNQFPMSPQSGTPFPGQPGQQFRPQPGQQYGPQPGQQQPGQQYPQQPQFLQAAPQPPKKKSRKGLAIVGGIVAVLVLWGMISGGGDDASTAAPASTAASTAETKAAETKAAETKAAETKPAETKAAETKPAETKPAENKLGVAVTSGDLQYTLSNFKCGVTVTDLTGTLKPQGKFCVVDVVVKNVGKKATWFTDDDIKLLDGSDVEYSPSDDILFVDGAIAFEEINPGNTIKGKVWFDIPTDAKPVQAQVKGGLFDKGQKISLA